MKENYLFPLSSQVEWRLYSYSIGKKVITVKMSLVVAIENRFRFLKEIIDAVKQCGRRQNVGVRFSPNGSFNDMGSRDYRELYSYVIEQLASFRLGYLHVMDGVAFGFHESGEPMNLAEVRQLYPGVIIANSGYDKLAAAEAVDSGNAELVSFGRLFISNPDVVLRLQDNWPLTPTDDMSSWYDPGAKGYIDYPFYSNTE